MGEGERTLNRALAAIESVGFTRESVATLVATLNQLGILWSERSDAEKAFQLFERARAGYVSFRSTVDESAAAPYPIGSHLVSHLANTGESDSLEVAHTQTLFYLAQVHMMLNDNAQGAKYCGETLLRQLKTRSSASFDPLQWAINAAGMCNFFLGDEAWPQAMHCLQAADAMFSSLDSHPPNSEVYMFCFGAHVADGFYFDFKRNFSVDVPKWRATGRCLSMHCYACRATVFLTMYLRHCPLRLTPPLSRLLPTFPRVFPSCAPPHYTPAHSHSPTSPRRLSTHAPSFTWAKNAHSLLCTTSYLPNQSTCLS